MSNTLVVLTDVEGLHVEPGLIGKDAPTIAAPKASTAFKPILLRRQIPDAAAPGGAAVMSPDDQALLPALLSSLIHQFTAEELQAYMPSLRKTQEVYTTQAFQVGDSVQIGFFSDQEAYTRQARPTKFLTIPRSDFAAHKQAHATKPQQEEDLLFTLQDDIAPAAASGATDKAPEPFVEPIHGEEIARLNSLQAVLNTTTESLSRDLKKKSDETLASSCKDLLQIKTALARYKTSVEENKDLQNSITTKPFILQKIQALQTKIEGLTTPPLENQGNIQAFYADIEAIKAEVDKKHRELSEEILGVVRHGKGLIALTEFSQQLSTILGKKEQVEQNVSTSLPQYKQVNAVQTSFTSLQAQIETLSRNIAAYSNAPTKEIPAKFFDAINNINRELEILIQTCNDSSSSSTREFIPKLYQLKSTVSAIQTTFFSINRKEANPERYVGQSLGDNWTKQIASLTQKARTWGGKKDREITENVVVSITKLINLMGNNDPSSEFLDGFRKYVVSSNKPAWIRLITPGDKFIVSKERQQQIQTINTAITDLLTGKKTTIDFLKTLIAIRNQITDKKNSRLYSLVTKEISRLTGSFVYTMKAALAPNVEPKQVYSSTFTTDLDHLLFVLQQDKDLKLDRLQTLLGTDQLPKAYKYLSIYLKNKLDHPDEIQYQQCDQLAQCLIDIYQRTPEKERSSYQIEEPNIDISRNSLFGLVLNKSLAQLAEVRVTKKPEIDEKTKAETKKPEIDEEATAKAKETYITNLIKNIQAHWDIKLHQEILALASKSEFSFLKKTEGFWQQYLTFLASKKEEIKGHPDLSEILAQKAQDYALEETLTKLKSSAFSPEEAFLILSGPTVSFLGGKYPRTYSGYHPKDLEDKVQKAKERLASGWPLRIIETRREMIKAKAYKLLEQGFEKHKKTPGNSGAEWLEYFHAHEAECEHQAYGDQTITDAAAERKLIEQLGGRDLSDLQEEAEKTVRNEANLAVITQASWSIDHILDENYADGILRLLGTIETNPQLWRDVLSAHSAEYEMRDQYGDTPPVQTRTHEYLRLHHLYGLTPEEKSLLATLSNKTEGYVRIRNDLFREINVRNKDQHLSIEVVGELTDNEIARQIEDLSEQQQRATMPTLVKKIVAALITSGKFSKNPTGKSLVQYLNDGKIFELTVSRQNQTTLKFEAIKYTYGSPEEIVSTVIDYYQTKKARKNSWDFVFINESDYSYKGSDSEAFKAILEWAKINVTAASPEKRNAATQIIVFAAKIILEQIGILEKMISGGYDANRLNTLFKHPIVQLYLSITSDTSTLEQAISQYVSKLFPYEDSQILQILTGKLPILSLPWKKDPQKPEELVFKNFPLELETLHDWNDPRTNSSPHLKSIKQTITDALQRLTNAIYVADVKTLEQEIKTWNDLAALDKTNPQWTRFQNMLPLIQEAKYFEALTQKYIQLLFAQRNFVQIKALLDQGYVISVKDRSDKTIKIFKPQSIMDEIIAQYKALYKQNDKTWTFLFAEANKDFLTQLVGWAQSEPEAQALLQFVDEAILDELQRIISSILETSQACTLPECEKVIVDFLSHPATAARLGNNPVLKAQVEQQKQIALAKKQVQVVQIFLAKSETTLDYLYTQLGITKLPRTIKDLVAIMTNIKEQAGDNTALLKAAQERLTKELQNIQQLLNDRDTSSWKDEKINLAVLQLINLIATTFATTEGKLPEEIRTVIDPILEQASKLITERVLTSTSLYLNKQDTTSGILNEQANAIVASYHLLATFGNEAQKQMAKTTLEYVKNDLFTAYLSAIAFSDKTVSTDWLHRAKSLLNALGDSLIQTIVNTSLTSPKDIRIASLKYLAILGYKDLLSTWIEGMNFNLIDESTTRKPDLSDKKDLLEAEKAWAKTLPLDQRIEIEATIAVAIHEGKQLGNVEGDVELPEYFKTTENSQAVLARLDHLKQSVPSCQKLQQEIQTSNILTQQPSLDSTCIGFTVPENEFTNFGTIFPKRAKSGSALSLELAQEEESVRSKGIFASWRAIQSTAPEVPAELQTALASIGNTEVVTSEMVVALNRVIANMYCQQLLDYIKTNCANTDKKAAIIETINAIFNTSGKYTKHYALILKYASEENKIELAANIKVFLSPQKQTVSAELDQATLNELGRSESSLVPAKLIAKDSSLSEQLTTLSSSLASLPQLMSRRQEQLEFQEKLSDLFVGISPTEQTPTTEQATTVDPDIQQTIDAINKAIKSVVQNGDSFHLLNLYSNLLAYSEKFKDNPNMSQAIEQLIVKHFESKDKLVQKFIASLTTQRRLFRDPVLALRLDVADQTKDQESAGAILNYYKQLLLFSSTFTSKERNQKLITLITMVFPDIEKTIDSILRQQIILSSSSKTDSAQQPIAKALIPNLSKVITHLAAIKDPKDGQISNIQLADKTYWGWKYNAKDKTWISSSKDSDTTWIYDPSKPNQLVETIGEISVTGGQATYITKQNTYDLSAYLDMNKKVASSTTTTIYDLDKFNAYRRLMITALEDAAEQPGAEKSLSYYATAIGGLYGQRFDDFIYQTPKEVVRVANERYEQQKSSSVVATHDVSQPKPTKSVDIRVRRHVSAPEPLAQSFMPPQQDTTTLMKKHLADLTQADKRRQEEAAKAFADKKDPHRTQQQTLPPSRLSFTRSSCAAEAREHEDTSKRSSPIAIMEDYHQQ